MRLDRSSITTDVELPADSIGKALHNLQTKAEPAAWRDTRRIHNHYPVAFDPNGDDPWNAVLIAFISTFPTIASAMSCRMFQQAASRISR